METTHSCDDHCDEHGCWYDGSDEQDTDQDAIDRAAHDRGDCESELCAYCY